MFKILFLSLTLILSGCATGPKFTKSKPKDPESAIIYIYRPSAFIGMAQFPDVEVNGELLGSLVSGSYLEKQVELGETDVFFTGNGNAFKWNYPDRTVYLNIKRSKPYYIRYSPTHDMIGTRMMIHKYSLMQVNEKTAIKEITDLSKSE